MAWYRAGGGGIPSSLKTDMNTVLNKKFGTSQDYPPTDWAPSVNLMGPLPEKTVSGAVAAITDGADEVPIKAWTVTVAPTLVGVSSVRCQAEDGNQTSILDTTVSLGRTICGGSVDVANGTGTDGYNKITLSSNLNGLTMAQIGTTGVYRVRFNLSDANGAVNTAVFNGLCDYYTPSTANQTYAQNEGIAINTSGQCFIYDSRFNTSTSLNDFKTWIDANPVNLCYELATGTDFSFTPISPTPETPLGASNFWADTGNSAVTYRADIDLLLGGN